MFDYLEYAIAGLILLWIIGCVIRYVYVQNRDEWHHTRSLDNGFKCPDPEPDPTHITSTALRQKEAGAD